MFSGKRVLVIVAHPDDESLYFAGGLRKLAAVASVRVLCMTHRHSSRRGQELRAVAERLGIKCSFLSLDDVGINALLRGLERALSADFEVNDADVVITHPPHGGERPHPHHVQAFFAVRRAARACGRRFAFFSEHPESLCDRKNDGCFAVSRSSVSRFLFRRILALRPRDRFRGFLLWIRESFFAPLATKLDRHQIAVDVSEKRSFLGAHESQTDVISTYRTAEQDREYLFIEDRMRP